VVGSEVVLGVGVTLAVVVVVVVGWAVGVVLGVVWVALGVVGSGGPLLRPSPGLFPPHARQAQTSIESERGVDTRWRIDDNPVCLQWG
jgi:hypothetical protein